MEAIEGVLFKQFNSNTDYYSLMFDLSVVPRRLRSSADLSKYYCLIEAALYYMAFPAQSHKSGTTIYYRKSAAPNQI